MIHLSDRVQAMQPSATFAIKAKAAALRAEGHDVVDLSAGEPDGSPPVEAPAAARAAIDAGRNRYAPVAGIPELRDAIAANYRARGVDVGRDNVLVTVGGKQALHHLALALLGPGDEVVLFSPYWVSYVPQFELAGATPVVVRTRPEDGFQPDLADVAAAITDRTRVILVNSPSNPTGCVISRDRLAALNDLAREHDLIVISDEIYDNLTYDGTEAVCFPTLSDDAPQRTVIVNAISKTYAMTGWRVGWMVGPVAIVKACAKLQGHSTSGVSPVNQLAALGAVTAPRDFLVPIKAALLKRRALLSSGLNAIDGFDVGPIPQGAFYLFPRVDGFFGRTTPDGTTIQTAFDVANYLIEQGVGVVPGEAFGEPQCVRISYALARETLEKGLEKLRAAVSLLS
ncbi:MAG: pyridoxal phosphate-dependent aminotransferase [Proteobacteria bacterium]|nr:pyridoxal phosphate-dependent aminotransferase [Pseudomonadota bacterium]